MRAVYYLLVLVSYFKEHTSAIVMRYTRETDGNISYTKAYKLISNNSIVIYAYTKRNSAVSYLEPHELKEEIRL